VPRHDNPTAAASQPSRARPSSFPAFASDQPEVGFARTHRVMLGLSLALAMMFGCSEACSQSTAVRLVAPDALAAPFAAFVAEASQRFRIPGVWIRAVMRAEASAMRAPFRERAPLG
jgi:hypothetical protein